MALVPVVTAPALARDVLDGEALSGGQRDVTGRAVPALPDGGPKDAIHLFLRDGEVLAESLVALEEAGGTALSGQRAVELVPDLAEVLLRVDGRDRVVECA